MNNQAERVGENDYTNFLLRETIILVNELNVFSTNKAKLCAVVDPLEVCKACKNV